MIEKEIIQTFEPLKSERKQSPKMPKCLFGSDIRGYSGILWKKN